MPNKLISARELANDIMRIAHKIVEENCPHLSKAEKDRMALELGVYTAFGIAQGRYPDVVLPNR